jgi:hypothetical protein
MRFMMLVIPKGYEAAAPDTVPDAKAVARMMEYNRSLQKAGVLLALDGLLPPSTGARVAYTDGKATAVIACRAPVEVRQFLLMEDLTEAAGR